MKEDSMTIEDVTRPIAAYGNLDGWRVTYVALDDQGCPQYETGPVTWILTRDEGLVPHEFIAADLMTQEIAAGNHRGQNILWHPDYETWEEAAARGRESLQSAMHVHTQAVARAREAIPRALEGRPGMPAEDLRRLVRIGFDAFWDAVQALEAESRVIVRTSANMRLVQLREAGE